MLKLYVKIDIKSIKSGDTEIEKQTFYQHKSPMSINNIDINKIIVSNKVLNIFLITMMLKK